MYTYLEAGHFILVVWQISASSSGFNFKAQHTAEFCTYNHHSTLAQQVPNFCASCVSVDCLVTWRTQTHKPKFPANPWNTHDVSKEFPASVSVDSLLTISRAMKFDPVDLVNVLHVSLALYLSRTWRLWQSSSFAAWQRRLISTSWQCFLYITVSCCWWLLQRSGSTDVSFKLLARVWFCTIPWLESIQTKTLPGSTFKENPAESEWNYWIISVNYLTCK